MPAANWRERIVIDPNIHQGVPCIKGTRMPVSILIGGIADGDSIEVLWFTEGFETKDLQEAKALLDELS